MSKNIAILLLAGDSTRFQSSKSKIFYEVKGKPLFVYPLLVLENCKKIDEIVFVSKESYKDELFKIANSYNVKKPISFVTGGASRTESVKNALDSLADSKNDDIVLICDGDRPNLTEEIILKNIESASDNDGCVTAVKTIDTILECKNGISYLDRKFLWNAQTPQSFKYGVISDSYKKFNENFTDDASIAVKAGYNIAVVEGSYFNYKITTLSDITRFESELEK